MSRARPPWESAASLRAGLPREREAWHRAVAALFRTHITIVAVARAVGSNTRTVSLWRQRVEKHHVVTAPARGRPWSATTTTLPEGVLATLAAWCHDVPSSIVASRVACEAGCGATTVARAMRGGRVSAVIAGHITDAVATLRPEGGVV